MALNLAAAGFLPPADYLSDIDFMKAVNDNDWLVFSQEDIDDFSSDISFLENKASVEGLSPEERDWLEKAARDRSKLILKEIVDKNGKRTKKWVKVKEHSPEKLKELNEKLANAGNVVEYHKIFDEIHGGGHSMTVDIDGEKYDYEVLPTNLSGANAGTLAINIRWNGKLVGVTSIKAGESPLEAVKKRLKLTASAEGEGYVPPTGKKASPEIETKLVNGVNVRIVKSPVSGRSKSIYSWKIDLYDGDSATPFDSFSLGKYQSLEGTVENSVRSYKYKKAVAEREEKEAKLDTGTGSAIAAVAREYQILVEKYNTGDKSVIEKMNMAERYLGLPVTMASGVDKSYFAEDINKLASKKSK